MVIFTDEEREIIAIRLGYDVDEIKHQINDITAPARKAEIDRLLSEIEVVRSAITKALSKAHVVEVGEIKLDYMRQIEILKQEGKRLLKLLAQVVGIPLAGNEFNSSNYYVRSWC